MKNEDFKVGIDGLSFKTFLGNQKGTLIIYISRRLAKSFGLTKGTIVDVTIKKSEVKA